MKVTKCRYCKKAFFVTNSDVCPYCGKNIKVDLDIFGNAENPLKDIFDGFDNGRFNNEKN